MDAALQPSKCQSVTPSSEESARAAANNWRGGCVALFTRAELAISEALVTLHDEATNYGRCHGYSARIETLAKLLVRKGDSAAANVLCEFAACYPMRVFLCHGSLSAEMLARTGWTAIFSLLSFSSEGVKRELLVIDEQTAKVKRTYLHSAVQKLEQALSGYAARDFLHDLRASGFVKRASTSN